MALRQPTEDELRTAGSLKWTGVHTDDGEPTLGAWVAEMDFGTSPAIEKRLVDAVRGGLLGYLPGWAKEGVAEALVPFLERRYGWVVKPEWVFPTATIITALHSVIEKLTRPDSPIIVPTPAYMPFLTIPGQHGREVIEVPALHAPNAENSEDAWSLDLDGIRAGLEAGAGLIILCNPWNPTGRVLTTEELVALHEVVKDYDALIFSDEVHAPLVFGDPSDFVPYASLGPDFARQTITAVGASKAWNVPGLNCAQIIIPDKDLRREWEEKIMKTDRGPIALGAIAAIEAYTDNTEWLDLAISQVAKNLDALEEAIEGTNVDYSRPEGTYLTWLGFDDYDFEVSPAEILREEFQVTTNSGETLGAPYRKWVRVNAAMSEEPWAKVVAVIKEIAGR